MNESNILERTPLSNITNTNVENLLVPSFDETWQEYQLQDQSKGGSMCTLSDNESTTRSSSESKPNKRKKPSHPPKPERGHTRMKTLKHKKGLTKKKRRRNTQEVLIPRAARTVKTSSVAVFHTPIMTPIKRVFTNPPQVLRGCTRFKSRYTPEGIFIVSDDDDEGARERSDEMMECGTLL